MLGRSAVGRLPTWRELPVAGADRSRSAICAISMASISAATDTAGPASEGLLDVRCSIEVCGNLFVAQLLRGCDGPSLQHSLVALADAMHVASESRSRNHNQAGMGM